MKAVEYWRTSKLWAAVNWNSRDCDEQHLSMTDPRCLCFPTISKKKILIFNSHQLLKCYWCSHSGAPRIADGGLLFPRKPRALGEEHGQVLCSNLWLCKKGPFSKTVLRGAKVIVLDKLVEICLEPEIFHALRNGIENPQRTGVFFPVSQHCSPFYFICSSLQAGLDTWSSGRQTSLVQARKALVWAVSRS